MTLHMESIFIKNKFIVIVLNFHKGHDNLLMT